LEVTPAALPKDKRFLHSQFKAKFLNLLFKLMMKTDDEN
tara:strand:+ start:286 stop:402 length:117 start_codon:yes stop_codon:yes gene_type:complete